jgi:general secretion pathway protein G
VLALVMTRPVAFVKAQSAQPSQSAAVISKETALKTCLFNIRAAIDRYYIQKKHYPPRLDSLASEGFIRAIPIDPFTNSKTSWRALKEKPDHETAKRPKGIYDVRSGSQAIALDGTKYASW